MSASTSKAVKNSEKEIKKARAEMKHHQGPEKGKTAANALVTAAAVIGILIGVNLIANRHFGRVDLTENHIYKLSPESREVVKNLPDRMNIKAFISGDLQAPLNSYGRYVRDLLDEYAAASGGKVAWEAIDPLEGKDADEKAKKKEDLNKYKVQKITLERISDSKLEIGSDNYLGIAFVYGGEIQSIPQVAGTEGLEYQITGIIKGMVATKKRKVAFATSEGELQPQQGLQYLSRVFKDYDTNPITLDKPVPPENDALFIVGPKQPFNEKAKYYIDQFIMSGKPVAIFVDGMTIEAPRGMQMPGMEQPKIGRANDVNLQDLFEKYGLKLHDDLVLDEQDVKGPVPVGGQMFLANYPTFVGISDKGLAKGIDLTKSLNALVMPFPSSLELVGDLKSGNSGVKATAVATTTKKSWRNSGFFVFNPTVKMQRPTNEADKGPFVLGYALEGKMKSAFAGFPGMDPNASAPENAGHKKESPDGTRLLVMASSSMVDDHALPLQYEPIYQNNLLFAINSLDWLIHDDSLIALRAKGMGSRPLTVGGSEGHVRLWVYANVLGIPLALVVFGLILWRVRTARRAEASLQ
jgi:gliding-associated putative ABC transporter substrate-binding component GldG